MSSSPHTDADLTTTVKRVPGGRVSNWMLDEVAEGDVLVLTRPAGVFTLRPALDAARRVQRGERHHPGDLGDQERAGHHRPTGAAALREPRSRLGDLPRELDALASAYPNRFEVVHHLDVEHGFVHSDVVHAVRGRRSRRRFLRLRSGTVHGRRGGRARAAARAVGPGVHRALRRSRRPAFRDEPPATPAPVAGRRRRRRRPSSSCSTARAHEVHYQAGRDVPRDRASSRTARAVLVRGRELRDVHGPPRRGRRRGCASTTR